MVLHRLTQRAYSRRSEPGDPVHLEQQMVRRAYGVLIEKAKREHLEGFLESLNEKSVWTAHRYASGEPTDGGRARIPPLKGSLTGGEEVNRSVAETNEDKSKLLHATFFPELEREDNCHADNAYLAPMFKFHQISDEQIHRVIARLGPFKVPGPDGIPNVFLIKCADLLVPHLGPLYWATFRLGVYPTSWRDSVMVILRKLGKPDYMLPNAHWPVALLNTMAKVLSACMAEDINHAIETQGLLSNNHFGSRAGWTTTDSLHYITKFVKDAWRRKEVVSALFLDIKSAFPSVVLDRLVHDMRNRGVPWQYTDWIVHKVTSCHTMLKFDGYESEPLPLSKGLDQGCPLSGIAFQFYNSDLMDIKETGNGEDAIA